MSTLTRFALSAFLGALLTCLAAALGAWARAVPWFHLLSSPLESIVTLVLYTRNSELYTAWFDGYWLVRQLYFLVLPVGTILGIVGGYLLRGRLTTARILLNAGSIGLLSSLLAATASASACLWVRMPIRAWDVVLETYRISLIAVFVSGAVWYGLVAVWWRIRSSRASGA